LSRKQVFKDVPPMLLLRMLILAAAALLITAPAHADGTVFRATRCGEYVFVSSASGFSVLRTDGGVGVKDGDQLRGEVERIGHPTLFDQNLGRSVFAQVTERNLSQAEVNQRIAVRCRSPLGDRPDSGYVTRAADCGNKIFVSTPQGVAVLERISGGVVADGDTLTGNFSRPGRTTVQDRQSNSTLVVFVEDVWLSRSAAERKMSASCRRRR
jgi:hypothetical protein